MSQRSTSNHCWLKFAWPNMITNNLLARIFKWELLGNNVQCVQKSKSNSSLTSKSKYIEWWKLEVAYVVVMIVVVHSTSRRPLKTSLQPRPHPSLQVKAAASEVSCTREMWGTRKHSPFTARPCALASKEPAEQQCSSSLGGWKWESEKESCILLWVLVLLETQPASVLWLRTSKTMKIVDDRILLSYGIIGMWWSTSHTYYTQTSI